MKVPGNAPLRLVGELKVVLRACRQLRLAHPDTAKSSVSPLAKFDPTTASVTAAPAGVGLGDREEMASRGLIVNGKFPDVVASLTLVTAMVAAPAVVN